MMPSLPRVELGEVDAGGHGELQRLFDEQVVDIELAVAAERDGSDDDVGVIELAGRHVLEVLAGGADIAVARVVGAVQQSRRHRPASRCT